MPAKAGFFKKEGLEVEFLYNNGGTAALQQVAAGKATFSENTAQGLMSAVGQGLPVVGVATLVPRQIYNVYVPKGSPITSYAALKGKRIGISSPTSGAYPFAQAIFASQGIDSAKDITLVTTGSGAPQIAALKSGDVVAVVTWDTQVATFANLGTDLVALPNTEIANQPADLITTNTATLKSDPGLVIRFSRAVLASVAYALANPDKALAAFKGQFPEATVGQTDEQLMRVIKSRLDSLKLSSDQKTWGDIPLKGYQSLMDVSVKFGAVKTAVAMSKVVDTSLLEQIQKFPANVAP
jgi:NitT/TauT family transport system substrate-binding protein